MAVTSNLGITELTEGQPQKEITINTAFETFDKALAGKLTRSVAGAVDVTLTSSEWVYAMYEFIGNTTADIDIIVPNATRRFSVVNSTTGPLRTLTLKTATGVGVVLLEGEHMVLEQNGADMLALTAGDPATTNLWKRTDPDPDPAYLTPIAPSDNLVLSTTAPTTQEKLEVDGGMKLGNSTGTADGILRWTGTDFEGRKASAWVPLTLQPPADEEATCTLTGTGFVTPPTVSARYLRSGNHVTLQIPLVTGVSNASAFTLTGLPTPLTPGYSGYFPAAVQNNGVAAFGLVYLAAANPIITIYPDALAGTWNTTGTKQLSALYLTYLLAP